MLTDLIPSSFRGLTTGPKGDFFDEFQKSMSRFASEVFGETELKDFTPRVEVEENDKAVLLRAELPGMTEKDVEVEIENDYLTVKGEKKAEREERNGGRYYSERSFGSFERTIRLPASVDREKIDAKIENGVLRVSIPKTAESKSHVKKIAVKP